jgi:hypothetical protein
MTKKSGSVTLEMLLEHMEKMEAIFEKIETTLNKNNKEVLDRKTAMKV